MLLWGLRDRDEGGVLHTHNGLPPNQCQPQRTPSGFRFIWFPFFEKLPTALAVFLTRAVGGYQALNDLKCIEDRMVFKCSCKRPLDGFLD